MCQAHSKTGVRLIFEMVAGAGFVYLLHLRPRYKHARHYLGYAQDVAARVEQHQRGAGARLTQVAVENDIALELVRVWKGDRNLERRLKRRKNAPLLCPLCNPNAYRRAKGNEGEFTPFSLGTGDPEALEPIVEETIRDQSARARR